MCLSMDMLPKILGRQKPYRLCCRQAIDIMPYTDTALADVRRHWGNLGMGSVTWARGLAGMGKDACGVLGDQQ